MSAILDFLGSSAGGGIFGTALGFIGRFVSAKWILPAETKAKIDLMTAQRNAATEEASWKGFEASQQADRGLESLPANSPPWVLGLYLFSEALRRLVRPLLTLSGLLLLPWVYNTITADAAPAQVAMAKDINFFVFTMCFWWFGERYSAHNRTPISLVPEAHEKPRT